MVTNYSVFILILRLVFYLAIMPFDILKTSDAVVCEHERQVYIFIIRILMQTTYIFCYHFKNQQSLEIYTLSFK